MNKRIIILIIIKSNLFEIIIKNLNLNLKIKIKINLICIYQLNQFNSFVYLIAILNHIYINQQKLVAK